MKQIREAAKTFLCLLAGVCMAAGMSADRAWASEALTRVSISIDSDLMAGDGLPDIELDKANKGIVTVKATSNDYYVTSAEWMTSSSKELGIGSEPSMRVTLTPADEKEKYFKSAYKASEVKINGGTFVSARLYDSELVVTLRLKPLRGTYGPPEDAYWKETKLGVAVWEKGEPSSGAYEVYLYRNKKQIFKSDMIRNTSCNLYGYMTEQGTYTFKVRAVPASDQEKKSGKKSEWTESGELLIGPKEVSDGTEKKDIQVKTELGAKKGWLHQNGVWYYYPEDNVKQQGGWAKIGDYWYFFDVDGSMMTGWQYIGDKWYFFYDNGAMATGWAKVNNNWYYLNPDLSGPEGSMMTGWIPINGCTYYFDLNGAMAMGWKQIDGFWFYFDELENGLEGGLLRGWIRRGGKTYYTDEHGIRVSNWQEIDGQWYYFYPPDGTMATDTYINGFYVDDDGIYRR